MEASTFILIETQAGKSGDVITGLKKLAEIRLANLVTGQYDVIAIARVPTLVDLNPLIDRIQRIAGISKTVTCLVIDNHSIMDTSTL